MLTLRRLADLATMVLVAIPLFGCGDPATGANAHKPADTAGVTNAAGETMDMMPADAGSIDRISRIEGRHFDLYRHYRMHAAADNIDGQADLDGAEDADDAVSAEGGLRHAVVRFSASGVSQALRGCSMRALIALD
ncbi:hypothetical protein RY831_25960 [Noviherbaspirillum sp. CPCC 100848]|uniref:Lipoprotein n=1 Tax=Noviherbaspirillum album TaxID=3080276 RepID=A0ABU6JGL3_9BURK|nr:hypothetical protein [Noviherbaspirillum sp. CPCC 100848]MEC4722616.1 hypothetical protein [Noviherbaspirillum sp. CPCC 100848]